MSIFSKHTFNKFLILCQNRIECLLDILFPIQCFSCSHSWNYCCRVCMKRSKPHPEICPRCHVHSSDYRFCVHCRSEMPALDGIIIWFLFHWVIQRLIIALKYHHITHVVSALTELLYYEFLTHRVVSMVYRKNPNNLMFTFIPSHRTRKYLQKGYNQSELLAKSLASRLGVLCYSDVEKLYRTRRQTGLSRIQRKRNLHGVYVLWASIPHYVTHMIIVDDVVSTGSTVHQLAKEIKKLSPNISVWWLCLARK
jgi:ComF family protein